MHDCVKLVSAAATTSILSVALLLLLTPLAATHAASATAPSLAVSPTAAIVGATITVTGAGFAPGTTLSLQWASVTASWLVQAIPTPQVTGIATTPTQVTLGSAQTNASGSFSAKVVVPTDYGGTHFIQAFASNGTALPPKATFIVEPSFRFSPTSGPAGTPITVTATGLSYGSYSTSYHLSWDNTYVGYMTALGSHGATNFTFYASGTPGTHFIDIYQGYPGPGYLNPQQGPPSSETQSVFGNYIPFHANFTITAERVVPQSTSSTTSAGSGKQDTFGLPSFGLLVGLAGVALFVSKKEPAERRAVSKFLVVVLVLVLVAIAGVGFYATTGQHTTTQTSTSSTSSVSSTSSTSSTSQTSTTPSIPFVPVATVIRPHISVPQNNATTGPRISITPDIASVGDNITVNGLGFAPSAQLPLSWSTRQGSNLLGYKVVNKPLRNVTTANDGSFSFTMKVPPDLGGLHFISSGNLTTKSNGTLFIQRSATLSTTQGPQGTQIQIIMHGVGWDFDTNIVAVDYDNSYIGYACGFNSGGNVTVTIVASGAPGIHTIDVYPSIWWGPSNFASQQIVEYRYPLLTPQDHPELMPSFHFTFLMTQGSNATQTQGTAAGAGVAFFGSAAMLSVAGVAAGIAVFYSALPTLLPSGVRAKELRT